MGSTILYHLPKIQAKRKNPKISTAKDYSHKQVCQISINTRAMYTLKCLNFSVSKHSYVSPLNFCQLTIINVLGNEHNKLFSHHTCSCPALNKWRRIIWPLPLKGFTGKQICKSIPHSMRVIHKCSNKHCWGAITF